MEQISKKSDIEQAERWLDERPATPGSTVWVVWSDVPFDGYIAVCAKHRDALQWMAEQPDPAIYKATQFPITGEGWPPNQNES